MSAKRTCPQCGALLREDALEGLCPDCLGKLVLGSEGPRRKAEGQSPRSTPAGGEVRRDVPIAPQVVSPMASGHPLPSDGRGQGEGQRFGDYELIEKIAHGGMGVVYKARQVSLNRIVAVKMIRADRLAREEDIRRFRTEAQAAAQLQHPNIVAIHEVGEVEGQHFYSMDFVAGQSLSQVAREKPLSPKQAARYVQKIAEAIHYAHQRGILHRDLKPSNVLIDENDEPRVADFGLAKLMAGDSELTLSGTVMGSPSYMPPEQARGRSREVTVRSDVYSLGAVLYDVLCGRPPFRAETTMETLRQVLEMEPVLPRVLNPRAPRDLETIVLKCLQKEPAKRYSSAQDLADELARFQHGEPIEARPISPPEKVWRWCRRKPAHAAAIASLLALAIGSPIAAIRINQARRFAERNEQLAEARLYVSDMNLGYQALLAGNFDRARDLLETHRHPQPDRRGFEWRYLWGRTRGDFEQEFTGHSNAINQVAWSADGQTLATHSMDRILKVWDLATGKERLTLTNITGLAGFSSDGARLFLGQDFNSVVVCDWQQGQVKPLLNHVGHLVAILADGQTIATTANDFALRLWDSGTGQMTAGLPGTGGFLVQDRRFQNLAVAISRDGRRAAVAKSRVRGERRNLVGASFVETISIWSVDTCRELITVSEQRDVHSMQFSPDGSVLAVSGAGGIVRFWAALSNQEPRVIRGHEASVRGIAFSGDGKTFATGSSDQTIRLWDLATGLSLATLQGHGHSVRALAFSPNGTRLASGSFDTTVKLWNLNRPPPLQMISGIKLGERTIDRPVFSEDGRFLAARCFTNQIRIWDTVSLREIASFAGQAVPLPRGFSRNGKTLLMYAAGKLKLYDVGSQTIARETLLENPPNGARGLALSTSAGLFAVSDQDKNVQLWDISTGRRIANLTMEPVQLRFSPDGTMLAGSELLYETSRRIHFWTPPSLAPLGSIASHEAAYIGIEFDFSPNGRLLATAGSQNRAVHLWDLSARRPMAILKGHRQETSGIAFSHDGRLLASSSSDGTIKLWDLSIRQEIATLVFNESGVKEIDSRVGQLYFSPEDSALLAVSYDGTGMRLFRAPTWEEIAKSEKGIDVEVK